MLLTAGLNVTGATFETFKFLVSIKRHDHQKLSRPPLRAVNLYSLTLTHQKTDIRRGQGIPPGLQREKGGGALSRASSRGYLETTAS